MTKSADQTDAAMPDSADSIRKELSRLVNAPLPPEWVALMEDYPAGLADFDRSEAGDGSLGMISDVELLSDYSDVLAINLEARAHSILHPDGSEFTWPDQLLIIGEDGDGDYFCLDTDGEYSGVLQFLHFDVEFEEISDSLQDYVDMLGED
ncbi:MAG: SMI1/KNR4 family protein [Planctomyces sp.]